MLTCRDVFKRVGFHLHTAYVNSETQSFSLFLSAQLAETYHISKTLKKSRKHGRKKKKKNIIWTAEGEIFLFFSLVA